MILPGETALAILLFSLYYKPWDVTRSYLSGGSKGTSRKYLKQRRGDDIVFIYENMEQEVIL